MTRRGAHRRRALVLGILGALGTGSAAAETAAHRLELVVEAPRGALPNEGSVLLERTSRPFTRHELPLAGSLAANLPEATAWRLTVEAAGFWAAPQVVVVPGYGPRPHVVRLWSTGVLEGRVTVEGEEERPESVSVGVVPPPLAKAPGPQGEVECPIGEDGRFACAIPAGRLDLVLRSRRLVPRYFWGVEVPAGESVDLGLAKFEVGASIAGRVEADGTSDFSPGRAEVRLVRGVASGASTPQTTERLRRPAGSAALSDRGWFQMVGVAPGIYDLEVAHPGFSTVRIRDFEVWEASESRIEEPIVLRRPLDLEVRLEPALDWRERPWTVTVLRAGDFSGTFEEEPIFDGPASGQGSVRVPGVNPGRFWIGVTDSAGSSFLSEPGWLVETAEDASRSFALEVVTVEGQVLLDDAPVPSASLWFGGRRGAVRALFQSDEEGSFYGVLPRDGRWLVEVVGTEVEAHAAVLVRADQAGHAEVELRLPNTEVFGRVVDETSRKPVPGAEVRYRSADHSLTVTSDAEGEFRFRAVPEGQGVVSADALLEGYEANSEEVLVLLDEELPRGPLELALGRRRAFRGRVLSRVGEAIPGAVVSVGASDPRVGAPLSRARTDLSGRFEVRVPSRAESFYVLVRAAGHALRKFEVDDRAGEPVLHLAREGGELELQLPLPVEELRSEGLALAVWQNGLPIAFTDLYDWSVNHGEAPRRAPNRFRFSRLASGDYLVCLGRQDLSRGYQPWTGGQLECASAYVSSNGRIELALRLPTGAAEPPPNE